MVDYLREPFSEYIGHAHICVAVNSEHGRPRAADIFAPVDPEVLHKNGAKVIVHDGASHIPARALGQTHAARRLDAASQLVSANRVTSFELEPQGTDDPQRVLLSVSGELDLTNATEFEEQLETLVAPNGSTLMLDLRRVAFIDSAVLHVLFRMARRLGKERFGLVLEPESAITRTLEIVGVPVVATIRGSVEELSAALS